jgi:hypothetical protein
MRIPYLYSFSSNRTTSIVKTQYALMTHVLMIPAPSQLIGQFIRHHKDGVECLCSLSPASWFKYTRRSPRCWGSKHYCARVTCAYGETRALQLTSLLRLIRACPPTLIVGLSLHSALTTQEFLNLLCTIRMLRGGTQVQRPIARNERLSHRGRVLLTVLRLRLVRVAAPYRLTRGCAKLPSGTVRHRRSLNKAVS